MRATSGFIRLFIRGIAWDAASAGTTLSDALQAAAQAPLKQVTAGKILIRARANGTEAFYSLPPHTGMTAVDVAEVVSRVLDQADVIRAANPAIADGQLQIALLAAFPEIRECRPDFTALSRFGASFGG